VTGPELLEGFPVFARLTPAQRTRTAAVARDVSYSPGTVVFGEGQPASGCWLIRSGQVALETAVPGRGQVIVHTLGPGDVLGWSWLVPPHHWHYTARASDRVSAVLLETGPLRALADADPALGYPMALGLLEAVIGRLQSTRPRLLDLYGSPRAS
jgi:CRP-like cAMP-binding protein